MTCSSDPSLRGHLTWIRHVVVLLSMLGQYVKYLGNLLLCKAFIDVEERVVSCIGGVYESIG